MEKFRIVKASVPNSYFIQKRFLFLFWWPVAFTYGYEDALVRLKQYKEWNKK